MLSCCGIAPTAKIGPGGVADGQSWAFLVLQLFWGYRIHRTPFLMLRASLRKVVI